MRSELIGKRKKRENQRNGNPQNFALFARDDCRSEVTGALPDDDCSGLTLYHTGLGLQSESERPGAAGARALALSQLPLKSPPQRGRFSRVSVSLIFVFFHFSGRLVSHMGLPI